MAEELSSILKAIDFAAKKHRDQRRKDKEATPYINHPIELAELLVNEGGITDIQVLVAAVLHDTIEDTETTYEELLDNFGKEIAQIVLEVTDNQALPKEERKRRQIQYASNSSEMAKLVKLADKVCNLRDISEHSPINWSLQRKRDYFDWAKAVVDEIRGTNQVLESLFDSQYAKKP